MMTNLFSSFDPSSYYINTSWLIAMLVSIFLMKSQWKIESGTPKIFSKIFISMKKEVQFSLIKSEQSTAFFVLFIFMFILSLNFCAIYPQNFSATSQICLNLPLSLMMWMTIVSYGWIKNTNHMLSHLVPQGTPAPLMSFMVLIELISNMIRPITLCVRLTANLIAGHLLMTLLGNLLSSMSMTQSFFLGPIPMVLTTLETGVALIQAYVFMTLITLYITEIK